MISLYELEYYIYIIDNLKILLYDTFMLNYFDMIIQNFWEDHS